VEMKRQGGEEGYEGNEEAGRREGASGDRQSGVCSKGLRFQGS
jgi:hypothetical protein